MAKAKSKSNPAKAPTKDGISTTDFAEKVGVSRQRVLDAIESGILQKSVKKKPHGSSFHYSIDEGVGLQEWADNIDPTKQRDQSKQAATKELSAEGNSNYKKAAAMRMFYQAKLAEAEFQERVGKLVSADKVKAEVFKIGRRVRDSLLGVPERVAAEVAAMTEPREIAIYLKEQIAAALKDLDDLNNVSKPRT